MARPCWLKCVPGRSPKPQRQVRFLGPPLHESPSMLASASWSRRALVSPSRAHPRRGGPFAARRIESASSPSTASGIIHQAEIPAAATSAVNASASATPIAVRQSSPTTNSHTARRDPCTRVMCSRVPGRLYRGHRLELFTLGGRVMGSGSWSSRGRRRARPERSPAERYPRRASSHRRPRRPRTFQRS
jgi:hypothetical protein